MTVVIVEVVFEERYWYPDDGSIVWLSGYGVVGDDGRFLAREAPELEARGLIVASVAGAALHHAAALESGAAAPGRALDLRRDRDNEHDPAAIAVLAAGGEQLGWVPRAVAARVAPQLDCGDAWSALALRESRPSPREPRSGLTMLLAGAGAIELRVVPRVPPPPRA